MRLKNRKSVGCEETKSVLEIDGNDWDIYDDLGKAAWVAGFIGGVATICNKYQSSFKKAEEVGLFGITVDQIEEGLNKFYKDSNNKRIRIVDAIYVIGVQIKGESPIGKINKERL